MKHLTWDEVSVEEDRLSGWGRKHIVIGISRSATSKCTLSVVKRTIISVEERWFWTYVTDAHGSENDCCIGKILGDNHIDLLDEPAERYETNEELE